MNANRRAAGNEQNVIGQSAAQIIGEFVSVIARDAEQNRLDAERLRLRHQRVAVRIGDLVRVERFVERFEFVAGGEEGDAVMNPGIMALSVGSTDVTMTNTDDGIEALTFTVVVMARD